MRATGILSGSDLPSSLVGQIALLLIIYTTFCDAFLEHDAGMDPVDILVTVMLGESSTHPFIQYQLILPNL